MCVYELMCFLDVGLFVNLMMESVVGGNDIVYVCREFIVVILFEVL